MICIKYVKDSSKLKDAFQHSTINSNQSQIAKVSKVSHNQIYLNKFSQVDKVDYQKAYLVVLIIFQIG